MSLEKDTILAHLHTVDAQRALRADDAELAARVRAIKSYQQRRFSNTYSDLLADARYAPAARFFLNELYGPGDFARRDAQFARVVPALVRLFPADIVKTVMAMSALHALSEQLDTDAARHLPSSAVDATSYTHAWQVAGSPTRRDEQIALVLHVGRTLDRVTRSLLLRQTLRLMRAPAQAAGLGDLQTMLESGFDTFRNMRGADEFLATVDKRERALSTALFAALSGAPPLQLLPSEGATR